MEHLKFKLPYIAESVLSIVPYVKYIYVYGNLNKNQYKIIYLVIPDTYILTREDYFLLMFELERMFLAKMNIKTHICFQYEKEFLALKNSSALVKKVISKGYLIHKAETNHDKLTVIVE
jgi:hypothetical protein